VTEPVSTRNTLHPGLETYPRWQWAALVYGPPIAVFYTTDNLPWIVATLGAVLGLCAAPVVIDPVARLLDRGRKRK
jgi:hypothetical protein